MDECTDCSGKGQFQPKGTLLVVDDNLMHLDTAKLYLERSGYKVFCAPETASAWTLVEEEKPELVLLDVVMPGGSGLDLLARIKSSYTATGVVVMTAFGSEDIATAALKSGALDYLRKPFSYKDLSKVVEKALADQREINSQDAAFETLKHAYEELQVSADSILQCMSAGVIAVDNNFCIRMINQAAKKILKVTTRKITGQAFNDVFPYLGEICLLKNTLESEKRFRLYEGTLPGQDGDRIVLVNTDVIHDFQGNKIGAVAIFEDITESRRKEEIMRERERLAIIGQMAAGMAHEIRNPLTVVKGFVQLISGKSKDPLLNKYLPIIIAEIDQMNQVIKDFLKLARPKPPEFKSISINEVIREINAIIEPQAYLKKTLVKISTGRDIPACLLDSDQIKQMLLNLAQNAMEAMVNGGTLEIETKYLAWYKEIRLDIKDTGCGVPVDKIKDLGVPFYTTKPEGTGLGLSIVYSIVDQHKGRVEVQSQEGYGTTFSVFLPVQ